MCIRDSGSRAEPRGKAAAARQSMQPYRRRHAGDDAFPAHRRNDCAAQDAVRRSKGRKRPVKPVNHRRKFAQAASGRRLSRPRQEDIQGKGEKIMQSTNTPISRRTNVSLLVTAAVGLALCRVGLLYTSYGVGGSDSRGFGLKDRMACKRHAGAACSCRPLFMGVPRRVRRFAPLRQTPFST